MSCYIVEVFDDKNAFLGWLHAFMGMDDTIWDTINNFEQAEEFNSKQLARERIAILQGDDYLYERKLDDSYNFKVVKNTQFRTAPKNTNKWNTPKGVGTGKVPYKRPAGQKEDEAMEITKEDRMMAVAKKIASFLQETIKGASGTPKFQCKPGSNSVEFNLKVDGFEKELVVWSVFAGKNYILLGFSNKWFWKRNFDNLEHAEDTIGKIMRDELIYGIRSNGLPSPSGAE